MPTLDQLQGYIASGQLRFELVNDGGGPGFGRGGALLQSSVVSNCSAVTLSSGTSTSLNDCVAGSQAV